MMKKIFAIALALCLIICAVSASAEGVLEKIKNAGVLVVGTEATYGPYEFLDDNANPIGCDIWLAQQIADELGVELKIQDMAFDGIINSVMIGDVDIGIAAFTVTPERAEVIDFTHQYELSEQLLVVKKGDGTTYATKESLAGKKVGAQMGTIQSELITSALPDSELFELDTYPNLAMEVINGNIVGFVCDKAVGEGMISQNDNLEAAEFAFSAEEAAFGKAAVIAKGNEDLVAVVNEVINKVTAEANKAKREEFWANVEVGKQYKGVVKSLTSYGAFVDVGGVDGLCHISELSWNNIKHPSEVVKVGDEIEVYVKSYDPENQKVSLGYKKEEDNPWVKLENEVPVGTEFTAPVVSITKFGAFVRIMPGIDGLVHISEISNERVNKVSDVLKVGDEVRVKLTAVDFDRKRISLSMKACLDEAEDAE